MKHIDVGRGLYALVDDCDYPELSKYRWRAIKMKRTFYPFKSENGKQISMHRHLLGLKKRSDFCDHIDGNGLNNQRSNLRVCTVQENNQNKQGYKNNKEGFKGVKSASKKKYMARITHFGKIFYLGTFDCPKKAALAYNEKAKELHGEFARLNQVE